jgi:metal-sulfur cluster biosynthetic enzyme
MPEDSLFMEALREIYDPEIPINIVDLGLIYRVSQENGKVSVDMTLTARGCPMAGSLAQEVKERLEKLEGVEEATVHLVWDPPWTPDRINKEALDRLFNPSLVDSTTEPAQPC